MIDLTRRPTPDDVLMYTAYTMARRGTCARMRVGAVIAREERLISSGYNGATAGMPHCHHRDDDRSPCNVAVHAEENAIAFAAKHGTPTAGATLYTTMTPCFHCARLIVNAGITRVVYSDEYRNDAGFGLLVAAGVQVDHWTEEEPYPDGN